MKNYMKKKNGVSHGKEVTYFTLAYKEVKFKLRPIE